jgi:hypothetical protein
VVVAVARLAGWWRDFARVRRVGFMIEQLFG